MRDVIVRPSGYYLDVGDGCRRFLGSTRLELRKNIGKVRASLTRKRKGPALIDRLREEARKGRRARTLAFHAMNTRAKAKKRAIMSRAEFDELCETAGGRCQLTGIRFSGKKVSGAIRRPWMPSVDRVDSSKGYERDNCRLVCTAVNIALNDFGLEVLCKIAGALVDKRRRGKLWRGEEPDGSKYAFTV